jgi:hypothetical protein
MIRLVKSFRFCSISGSGDGIVMGLWWEVMSVNFVQFALFSMNRGLNTWVLVGGARFIVNNDAICGYVAQSGNISQSDNIDNSGLVKERDSVVLFSVVGIRGVFIRTAFWDVWIREWSLLPLF